jgi:thiol-disulfide isomerase/thioredoxin
MLILLLVPMEPLFAQQISYDEILSKSIQVRTSGHFREMRLGASDKSYMVIDFWATWCAPCISARSKLDSIHDQ